MTKIDWHAGFVSAMKLELIDNEDDLSFIEEQPIANRAQRIDLLIIRNDSNVVIRNPIGAIFNRFNICEYKSPGKSLNYGDFFKTLAYTSLYLYETPNGKQYSSADYTMTFVREAYPRSLFDKLTVDGINIRHIRPGIYELTNKLPFKCQMIITKDVPDEYGSWLRCLTKSGTEADLINIVTKTPTLET